MKGGYLRDRTTFGEIAAAPERDGVLRCAVCRQRENESLNRYLWKGRIEAILEEVTTA